MDGFTLLCDLLDKQLKTAKYANRKMKVAKQGHMCLFFAYKEQANVNRALVL